MDINLIEKMLLEITESNMTPEDKIKYTKKILKYFKKTISYYKDMIADSSLASLFIGMGLGTHIMNSEDISYVLYGIGGVTFLTTTIKKKIKYKDIFENKTIIETIKENK